MAEYIEKEAAVEAIRNLYPGIPFTKRLMQKWHEENRNFMQCESAIERLHSTDVQPVRHGRWVSVPHKKARICSRCEQDEPYKFADEDANVFDYCPNCGAKMDGGEP